VVNAYANLPVGLYNKIKRKIQELSYRSVWIIFFKKIQKKSLFFLSFCEIFQYIKLNILIIHIFGKGTIRIKGEKANPSGFTEPQDSLGYTKFKEINLKKEQIQVRYLKALIRVQRRKFLC